MGTFASIVATAVVVSVPAAGYEYRYLQASSITSPNQKSYTSPKWKTKQNKRMTERQEEENKHNITVEINRSRVT